MFNCLICFLFAYSITIAVTQVKINNKNVRFILCIDIKPNFAADARRAFPWPQVSWSKEKAREGCKKTIQKLAITCIFSKIKQTLDSPIEF